MPADDRVYCRIDSVSLQIDAGYHVLVILPYGPMIDPAEIRASWPRVERSLARALEFARHTPAGTPLPAGFNHDILPLKLTVPSWVVEDPKVDLLRYLERHIQLAVIAAIRSWQEDRLADRLN